MKAKPQEARGRAEIIRRIKRLMRGDAVSRGELMPEGKAGKLVIENFANKSEKLELPRFSFGVREFDAHTKVLLLTKSSSNPLIRKIRNSAAEFEHKNFLRR